MRHHLQMALWKLRVQLTRDLRGDKESELIRAAIPQLTAFCYSLGESNVAIEVEVEGSSRLDAQSTAREVVAAVVGDDFIDGVVGADDTMQNRQVMFWLLAVRSHLRSWEVVVAKCVKADLNDQSRSDALIWQAQLTRHMTFVSAFNLVRALKNADQRFQTMPEDMAAEMEVQRHVQEHWDEQWPSFYNASDPGPLTRSGKTFAERHPGKSPYDFLSWDSQTGPRLAPGLTVPAVHEFLNELQAEVLAAAPDLERFIPPEVPSPWMGSDSGDNQWWPR